MRHAIATMSNDTAKATKKETCPLAETRSAKKENKSSLDVLDTDSSLRITVSRQRL
jgi:hypothetical protein